VAGKFRSCGPSPQDVFDRDRSSESYKPGGEDDLHERQGGDAAVLLRSGVSRGSDLVFLALPKEISVHRGPGFRSDFRCGGRAGGKLASRRCDRRRLQCRARSGVSYLTGARRADLRFLPGRGEIIR
jgi:hypothetical protein